MAGTCDVGAADPVGEHRGSAECHARAGDPPGGRRPVTADDWGQFLTQHGLYMRDRIAGGVI